MTTAPQTTWQEVEAKDEAARVTALAAELVAMQKGISQKEGSGRALHRKQLLGLTAVVDVVEGLPPYARHGVFAAPKSFEALVRLSNGGAHKQPDRTPDVRGFALKILGVDGENALGTGDTDNQDFLFINASAFAFPTGIAFLEFVVAMGKSPLAAVGVLFRQNGLGAFGRLAALKKGLEKPFSGFATETLHSTNPLACGPYAMKLRLVPSHGQAANPPGADLGADVADRLRKGPLTFDLQAQFFVDEDKTPIENAQQDWAVADAPFVTVAKLTIPQQDTTSTEGQAVFARCESDRFDPWRALMAHRPLGSVMRARKQAYFASAQARG